MIFYGRKRDHKQKYYLCYYGQAGWKHNVEHWKFYIRSLIGRYWILYEFDRLVEPHICPHIKPISPQVYIGLIIDEIDYSTDRIYKHFIGLIVIKVGQVGNNQIYIAKAS